MDSNTLTVEQQLALVVEFRVPIPRVMPVGGYGEVVVRRDETGDGWAVTDGALVGLRAWTEGEDGGWRPVWDIGRAVAYKHTREQALALAHRVAEYEAINHQVLLGVIADPLGHAVRTRRHRITCPRCHHQGIEEYGEAVAGTDDYADCARCPACRLEWALDPGADVACTTCGGSGIPGAGPIGRRTPDGWQFAPTCGCVESSGQ